MWSLQTALILPLILWGTNPSDGTFYVLRGSLLQRNGSNSVSLSTLMHSTPKVITSYISHEETKIIDIFSNGKKDIAHTVGLVTRDKLGNWYSTDWQYQQKSRLAQCCKLSLVFGAILARTSSPVLHRALFLSLPPPLQRQHRAMKDWRQSDILRFILPESLRMLSVPHEGSDESRLSVRHLIISQKKSLWCYPLTMAHSSLLTTVPTNNEELTAATNGDGVVPTVHLGVRQIK